MRLSEKHGLNTTIPVCFWCGEHKNEIALMGRLPGDKEAPRNAVFDYDEPCDACKAKFDQGIAFFEVDGEERDCKPTGNFAVVKESAVREIVTPPELCERILKCRKANVAAEAWQRMFGRLEEK